MAEHVWSILCDSAILDAWTNKISLIGTVEHIRIHADAEKLQAEIDEAREKGETVSVPVGVELVSFFVRSDPMVPEKFEIQPIIECPDGNVVIAQVVTTVDLSEAYGFRVRGQHPGFPFRGFGIYWFGVIKVEDVQAQRHEPLARVPVVVMLAEEEPGQP